MPEENNKAEENIQEENTQKEEQEVNEAQACDTGENEKTVADAQTDEAEKADSQDEDEVKLEDDLSQLSNEALIEKLKESQKKADENWDQVLRYQAEAQNVRRRSENDVIKARKFAIEKLAKELLPVVDSMELGIKASQDSKDQQQALAKIQEGMEMTLKMLLSAMEKSGIEVIDPKEGDTFNPELHQAMSMQEIEGKESNTIVSVFQKGYSLNDRVLRAAMVMVAK